jgi:hypothetical protein
MMPHCIQHIIYVLWLLSLGFGKSIKPLEFIMFMVMVVMLAMVMVMVVVLAIMAVLPMVFLMMLAMFLYMASNLSKRLAKHACNKDGSKCKPMHGAKTTIFG